ncbi:sex-lethal homolog isoform X2 [Belonocnema kinseyi]|uniref:sex-lethal homolog isoform X2 n=1 Tax=Belonocnema kinseyi TaxID=2817044 RepID=UPI00143DBB46|nr:sex-lethal homolog isoform X2 [Belonocnema kinseyi]
MNVAMEFRNLLVDNQIWFMRGSNTHLQQIPATVTPVLVDQRFNGNVCNSNMTDHQQQRQQQQHHLQHQHQQQQHQQQNRGNGTDSRTNLIINYLPQSMTEKELYSMFVTIGPVESCRVMKDYKTGYSYGFGFVNYAKAEDAATAIATLNGLQVQNKKLKVSLARPSGEEIKETNLYVTNLPRNITDNQIEDIFNKFGAIVQKNILKDKLTGLPRGVAFVRYDKREEAQEAINHLNGTIPDGGSEPLSVKIAEEHGKQKAAYYAGWQAGGGMAGRGRGGPPGGGIGVGMGGGMPGVGAGGPPGMLGRGGGFGPRGGHHFGGGVGGGPGAMRMEKMHPHRFNPIGMSGGISGGGGTGGGGGYGASNFW